MVKFFTTGETVMGAHDGAGRILATEEAHGFFEIYAGKLKECDTCSDFNENQRGSERCSKERPQHCNSLRQKVVYVMTRSAKGKKN